MVSCAEVTLQRRLDEPRIRLVETLLRLQSVTYEAAHLTNTRSLALIVDPIDMASEILLSFSSSTEKKSFLDLIRSNDDLGNEHCYNDFFQRAKEEIARPLGNVLPRTALTRAILVATSICDSSLKRTLQ